jgi:predicted HAD superfamily Cof-like phosphohydrolase
MKKQLDEVAEFHKAFLDEDALAPQLLREEVFILRHDLMKEENEEYIEACWKGDISQVADALGDQLYVLLGTILKHGLQDKIEEIFTEIHKSNMSKLGADGKPVFRADGKILKGSQYFKPNILKILE